MNKIIEMVSFELAKTLTKMFSLLSRARDKEKILSPHEESNVRTLDFVCLGKLCYQSRFVLF